MDRLSQVGRCRSHTYERLEAVGYYTVIFLAGLQGIPEQLYGRRQSTAIHGEVPLHHIPMLSPTTFLVSILLVINSFKVFDQIVIMTDGGPGRATNVLVYYIYYQAFLLFRFGYASAIATVLLPWSSL